MKVLVVDDDAELRGLVAFALRQAGYFALEASDGETALGLLAREHPALVVLDVNLPHLDGFEVLRRIRLDDQAPRTPVLMLTVRTGEEDQVRGLDLGADDYLGKPFSPRTLLARVRALLRRAGAEPRVAPLRVGPLALDLEGATLSTGEGQPHRLTPLELRLLQLLFAQAPQPVATERLLVHVWGARGGGDRQLLKQLVHRLRQKIEADPTAPRHLLTVGGIGYAIASNGSEAR